MTTTETIIDKSADKCPFCESSNITPLVKIKHYSSFSKMETTLSSLAENKGKMRYFCNDCRKTFYIQYCPECGGTTTLRGAYSEALDEGYSGFDCDDPKCNWDDIS